MPEYGPTKVVGRFFLTIDLGVAMRTKTLLAVATCSLCSVGFGLGSGVALAEPSPNADCVAKAIAAGGQLGATPGNNGPAGGTVVSALAQTAHDACYDGVQAS